MSVLPLSFGSRPPRTAQQASARIDGLAPYPFWVHGPGRDQFISQEILSTGVWESFETEVVKRLLGQTKLFIDLGANIGWYTALAQRVMSPDSEIHAFEPDRENFRLLKTNTAKTRGAKLHLRNMAVGDHQGEVELFKSATNLGDHRLSKLASGQSSVRVPMTTLDAYFAGRTLGPLLAKIDTQGSEGKILRGAANILSPARPDDAFVIEFWPKGLSDSGERIGEFARTLSKFGQRPFILQSQERRLIPTSWPDLARRAKTDLHPRREYFLDILMAAPNSQAFAAIADLIQG
ncbi:MAG: FkbM family methyltransferase [Hyphomonadaceae bacterium]|nr:FkbM family methyltransferase [Hyphomonadaceae bacterium]